MITLVVGQRKKVISISNYNQPDLDAIYDIINLGLNKENKIHLYERMDYSKELLGK